MGVWKHLSTEEDRAWLIKLKSMATLLDSKNGKRFMLLAMMGVMIYIVNIQYGPDTREKMYRASRQLDLSNEQAFLWKQIHQKHMPERNTADGRKIHQVSRDEMERELSAILSDQQLELWKTMKEQRPRRRGHGPRKDI